MNYDPIGPGTDAWNASYQAIRHGIANRPIEKQAAIDEMTRHLIDHGASAQLIREWETYIEERIADTSDHEEFEEPTDPPSPTDTASSVHNTVTAIVNLHQSPVTLTELFLLERPTSVELLPMDEVAFVYPDGSRYFTSLLNKNEYYEIIYLCYKHFPALFQTQFQALFQEPEEPAR
jgi:hypothetical protein